MGIHESALMAGACAEQTIAQIIGVGTGHAGQRYTQQELVELFAIADPKVRSVFLNSGIDSRYLSLPEDLGSASHTGECQGLLLEKHREQGLKAGREAIERCLANIGAGFDDIDCLTCVTTTGMLTPGFSALLCKALNLPPRVNRLDIIGMGCSAGLNGLGATANWSAANPGKLALVLCVEICSAAYVVEESLTTAVVNSLFGDGASCAALVSGEHKFKGAIAPAIKSFSSYIISDAIGAMYFDWDKAHDKFNFYLSRDVPYVIGSYVERAVAGVLDKVGWHRNEVDHWVVHSGGKKVVDAIRVNLGLSRHDLRHTLDVLRQCGNMSSGSFLFSFERLMQEGKCQSGDKVVMMTMGPGAAIETCALVWA